MTDEMRGWREVDICEAIVALMERDKEVWIRQRGTDTIHWMPRDHSGVFWRSPADQAWQHAQEKFHEIDPDARCFIKEEIN